MGIFRGVGGVGDADTDAFASEVNEDALTAEQKANEAAASAAQAAASATQAASSASSASSDAAEAAASISTVISAKDAAEDARDTAIAAKDTAVSAQAATATSETNAAASAASSSSSATAAAASETSAAASATSATVSANTATTKATEAATSATNALASANTAANSATEAATVVQGIQDDVTQSAANAAAAQAAADNAIDLEAQAAASAANALNSATAAAGSATSASASAATATTKATQSASSATAALASENAAASSETASAASEAAAAASVTAATTQATNAATSASQAATSASNSADSATLAAASEAAAALSETNAANSATAASGSQTAAASSAAAALASQQAAATSASSAATSASSATTSATSAASSAATATSAKDTAVAAQTSASSSASAASTSATNAATSALAADQSAQDAQSIVDGLGVVASITSGDIANWDAAHSWGDHSLVGYVEENTSPTFANVSVTGLTVTGDLEVQGTTTTVNSTNLAIADNLIYLNDGNTTANVDLGWVGNYNDGTYAHTGIYRDATDGRFKFFDSYTPEPDQTNSIDPNHASFSFAPLQVDVLYATGGNSGQWNTAYSWGDHSLAGYADSTSVQSQIDAVVASLNTANWDTAYSWGNHAAQGYLTSFTETDPVFSASPASGISAGEISNWNTAYSWGNHAGLYAAASHSHSYLPLSGGTLTGDLSFGSQTGTWITSSAMTDSIGWNGTQGVYIGSNQSGNSDYVYGNGTIRKNNTYYTLWHSGNDGSGSGLDADLLDGQHGSYYYAASNPSGYIAGSYLNDYTRGAYRHIADYSGSGTWNIRSNGYFIWARAHDWTQSFMLDLGSGTSGAGTGWADFGQKQSNSATGTWRGTRFVRYSGSSVVDADVRAANYYIAGDTYYFKNGSWGFRHQTPSGYIEFGPANTGTAHIYTDRGSFYFNVNTLYANGSTVWHSGNDGSGSGLDADNLDGRTWSESVVANTIVSRQANGYIYANHINFSTSESENPSINSFFVSNGDGWSRKATKDHVRSQLGLVWGSSGKGTTNIAFGSTANSDSGFYDVYNNGTPTGTWYSMINMAHYGGNHGHQIAGSFYAHELYHRYNSNGSLGAWSKIWSSLNDGSGSGLDADLLDGQHASAFAPASHSHNYVTEGGTSFSGTYPMVVRTGTRTIYSDGDVTFNGTTSVINTTGGFTHNGNTVWSAANDGSGSGLDADLLDGLHGSAYLKDNGWNSSPGQDANTQAEMMSDFTYSNNAPWTGNLIRFGASGYSLQLNARYNSGGNTLSFRTYNNDSVKAWNAWRTVWHDGNDGSGSGLDADLLDGKHASSFALSSHSHSYAAIPTASMSSSGYWKCNSTGLIIQWGNKYVGNNGSDYFSTWTFPLAFPNACWNVYVTLYNTTGNSFDASSAITSQTTSSAGFTVQEWSNQYQAITARFIAIGY